MPHAMRACPQVLLFAFLAFTTGCMTPPAHGPLARRQPPSAGIKPGANQPATAELRIPGEATARASGDLPPLVPLPTVPLGQTKIQPTGIDKQPAVVPASARENAPASPAANALTVRDLLQQATATYATMDSYIARLTRREQINGKGHGEETIFFKFRKQPWSVYFKWLGENGKGREVIFVKGQYGNQIHTLLAAGDHPLKPAGARMSVSPDSVFVRMATRHPITEAGIGSSIERLGILLNSQEQGDTRHGALRCMGLQQRPDYPTPLAMVEQTIPPGAETSLPTGGKRYYGFDMDNHLPVLVTAIDDHGQEMEYYRYDRLQYPVRLDTDDFNPDRCWGKERGQGGR